MSRIKKICSVALDPDLIDRLSQEALQRTLSRSKLVTEILTQFFRCLDEGAGECLEGDLWEIDETA